MVHSRASIRVCLFVFGAPCLRSTKPPVRLSNSKDEFGSPQIYFLFGRPKRPFVEDSRFNIILALPRRCFGLYFVQGTASTPCFRATQPFSRTKAAWKSPQGSAKLPIFHFTLVQGETTPPTQGQKMHSIPNLLR